MGDEFFPALTRLSGEGESYREFVGGKKDRVKMVYVGANDGMVHGFVAGEGAGGSLCDAAGLGQEALAYVPGAVVGRLPHLAKPDYTHRFYVDGPLYAGDAYLDLGDGNKWRTLLLGGLGNGGRAVFALDVTNPCAFDANKVLWEFSSANDADLGYTHARPLIAKLNNGLWAAVVANGYNSANGHAVLFLLDLKTGAVIKKIDADAGAGGLDNGLMSPTLYDENGDGIIDHVYAGDNLGRLWKFDLSSSNPTEWRVAYEGQPLFTTGGEPIQAAPRLGDPPAGEDGVMVYFGSGRLVSSADVTDTAERAIYAVLDSGSGNLTRADLAARSVTAQMIVEGRTIRRSTVAPVDYSTQKGWYLPLGGGERIISPAQFVSGRILFSSVSPTADPCSAGGESWLYELDPITGSMPEASIFDFGTTEPVQLAALKLSGLSKSAIFLRDYGVGKGVMLAQDITGKTKTEGFRLQGLRLGRVSWREIIE
ncbi:MAG: pilus assembly protein [Thiobacillaceae bacterium]